MALLNKKDSLVAKNGVKLAVKRPDLAVKFPVTGHKRYFLSLARKTSRPGIFESLGSYDLNTDDAELFGDDRYRRLMNILIYRSMM